MQYSWYKFKRFQINTNKHNALTSKLKGVIDTHSSIWVLLVLSISNWEDPIITYSNFNNFFLQRMKGINEMISIFIEFVDNSLGFLLGDNPNHNQRLYFNQKSWSFVYFQLFWWHPYSWSTSRSKFCSTYFQNIEFQILWISKLDEMLFVMSFHDHFRANAQLPKLTIISVTCSL